MGSAAYSFSAPKARAACSTKMPMMPVPMTATFMPFSSRPSPTPCTAAWSGSISAASEYATPVGNGSTDHAGTTMNSLIAPSACGKLGNTILRHMLLRPSRHMSHLPHAHSGVTATGVPTAGPSTPCPSWATAAENSCPWVKGWSGQVPPAWPSSQSRRSDGQMDTAFTATRISPGPGVGFSTSTTLVSFGPNSFAALMVAIA